MRPIHEKLMKEINKFGEFEIVPKKGLCQSAAQETIRDDRPQDQHPL